MRSVQPALYCSELLATPNWYRQIHTLFTQTPHGNSTTHYHVTSGSDVPLLTSSVVDPSDKICIWPHKHSLLQAMYIHTGLE